MQAVSFKRIVNVFVVVSDEHSIFLGSYMATSFGYDTIRQIRHYRDIDPKSEYTDEELLRHEIKEMNTLLQLFHKNNKHGISNTVINDTTIPIRIEDDNEQMKSATEAVSWLHLTPWKPYFDLFKKDSKQVVPIKVLKLSEDCVQKPVALTREDTSTHHNMDSLLKLPNIPFLSPTGRRKLEELTYSM